MTGIKEYLKKEVYTLRLTKKNRIIATISAYYIMISYIFLPFAGFFLGVVFVMLGEPSTIMERTRYGEWFFLILISFVILPLAFLVIAEKFVFKTLIETKAARAEDIEVAVILEQLKMSFASYLDRFPYKFVVFKQAPDNLQVVPEKDGK